MNTKDEIQESINSRLVSDATKIEGGTIQDIIGSVAYELANIVDTRIDVILDNAFVSTADEEHLIIKGQELGIIKKEATNSLVVAKITKAKPNTLIKEDVMAKTEKGVVFKVINKINADSTGSALVKMKCLETGSLGNIEIGELVEFYASYEGLETAEIINEQKGYDGFENEDIEEYRARILEYMQDDACNSNISDYILWAKSVAGVKNVVVQDASIEGAGCVGIYISASDNEPVSDELISAVYEKIKKEQIINAHIEVKPLEYMAIDIEADLFLSSEAEIKTVKAEFKEAFEKYISTRPSVISYLYVTTLLFETKGVLDIKNYKLNNSTASVETGALKVPVIGDVVLNVI